LPAFYYLAFMPNAPAAATESSMEEALASAMATWRERGLERLPRAVWSRRGADVMTAAGPAVDFSSNDYLGLASDPRIAQAAAAVLDREGAGATASRLIAGTHPEHEALERELAAFFETEAALTFATGYAANTGAIPALVSDGDLILSDALNHASLIDGCRLSRAEVCVYPHGDPDALATLLAARRAHVRRALIVTDGMFSMDGDRAPLRAIVDVARQYDAWTYVDDAHGVGILGGTGRGTVEEAGVTGQVDVCTGTMGKAFGVAGAFVHGSRTLVEHLLNRARSFVFSTAMMPAQAAACREALRIVRAEPGLRARARDNARALRDALGSDRTGEVDSHIVPVPIGDSRATIDAGRRLRDRGFLVGAVRPPTVPAGTARLRLSSSAAHTPAHIRGVAAAVRDIVAPVA
jgi:8-amino-7-oxononanoate synthase